MKCPVCQSKDHVELDMHADGFADDLLECGTCGAIWSEENNKVKLLQGRTRQADDKHRTGECPFCHNEKFVELDIHADGFGKDLQECGFCGAVWSGMMPDVNVLHGPTWARALM